jgi:hypothetical protein
LFDASYIAIFEGQMGEPVLELVSKASSVVPNTRLLLQKLSANPRTRRAQLKSLVGYSLQGKPRLSFSPQLEDKAIKE